jgi:hypothetical protein
MNMGQHLNQPSNRTMSIKKSSPPQSQLDQTINSNAMGQGRKGAVNSMLESMAQNQ